MGFYGNITNTSKTNFVFDKIYTNRKAMDENISKDGIFIGRYVLVEYGQITNDSFIRVYGPKEDGYYHTSNDEEEVTRILYTANKNKVEGRHITNGIIIYTITKNNNKDIYNYYECNGGTEDGAPSFTNDPRLDPNNDPYFFNFNQDKAVQKYDTSRGYDGTVWIKTSVNNEIKYVNIAELNSVVPSFEMIADAPTMSPILPHFDTASNNVYYKLHWQPAWGVRVAEADNPERSDYKTAWSQEFYNKETGEAYTKWYNPATGEWDSDSPCEIAADIYFNKAAFDPQINQTTINKTVKMENYMGITADGLSGNEYNLHDGTSDTEQKPDTQQIHINLPAIGNMMSEAWDIIHGPKRDNAQTDNNSSLQGRLDSFKAMEKNAIPMKRNNDGTFVGSRINGNSNRTVGTNKILEENLSTSFDQDDAWIRTKIDTTNLDNKNKLSGISIHHTWHKQADTTSTTNKNSDNVSSSKASDKIDLYTPIVDKAGHVVGKNTETVTLPYGFKTFTTKGLAPLDENDKEIVSDLYTTISNVENGNNISSASADNSQTVANNTQDSMAIEPYNKWIQTQLGDDKLVIAHEVHAINTEKSSTDLNDLKDNKIQNEINIPDWDYDDAGHIKKKGEHIYTLPFGFKTIQTINSTNSDAAPASTNTSANNNTNTTEHIADTTQDILKFAATNKWITMQADATDDVIKFGHVLSPIGANKHESSDKNIVVFGDSFNILNFTTDAAGHVTAVAQDTITIPKGSLNDLTATGSSVLTGISMNDETGAITQTNANVGTLKLTGFINDTGDLTSKTLQIDSNSTINNAFKTIQNHINNLDLATSNSDLTWIVDLTQKDGLVAVTRAGTDSLKINNYNAEGQGTGRVANNDVINIALAKLQNQIIAEEENRKNAINTLYGGNAENIADTFDTIKEIADFLEQDNNGTQSGVEKIISDINANTDAIEAEGLRATSAETNLAKNIAAEETRATGAEQTLTTNLSSEIARAKEAESTLNTRITTLVGTTSVSTQIAEFGNTLGTAAKSDAEDFAPAGYYDNRVLTSVYEAKIASLEATIAALDARIAALETPASE